MKNNISHNISIFDNKFTAAETSPQFGSTQPQNQFPTFQFQNPQFPNQSPMINHTFSPFEQANNGNQTVKHETNNFSTMWNKGVIIEDSKLQPISVKRKTQSQATSPKPSNRRVIHQAFYNQQNNQEFPEFKIQNKKTTLSFQKQMLDSVMQKNSKYQSSNMFQIDQEEIIKYDLSMQRQQRAPLKFSYQDDEEHDLDKWKDFKNKSLIELLNNNKKFNKSELTRKQNKGNIDKHQQLRQTAYSQNKAQSGQNDIVNNTEIKEKQGNLTMMQIERDLQMMQQSLNKLRRSPVHSQDQEKLQSLKNLLNDQLQLKTYFSQLGEEYAQKDQDVINMLAQVKRMSSQYRKRKIKGNLYKDDKQKSPELAPQKRKIGDVRELDQNVLNKYMDDQQNAVFTNKQNEEQRQEMKVKPKVKEVKISLLDEYKDHLKILSKLQHFSSLKLYMDHSFFQTFMPLEVVAKNYSQYNDSQLQQLAENKFNKSVIVPNVHSYLDQLQEEAIPKEQLPFESNKKFINLFFEIKSFLTQQIKKKEVITQKQEEQNVSLPFLKEYFLQIFQLIQSLMKIYSKDQEDIIPAFILDNIFKSILLKVDDIIANNERVISKAVELQKFHVKQMKHEFETEINYRDEKLDELKKQHHQVIEDYKARIQLAQTETQRYKELFLQSEAELTNLTSFDNRKLRLEDMKDSYNQISTFIMQMEDQHTKQMKVLDQYSKMIDLSPNRIVQKTKVEKAVQVDSDSEFENLNQSNNKSMKLSDFKKKFHSQV